MQLVGASAWCSGLSWTPDLPAQVVLVATGFPDGIGYGSQPEAVGSREHRPE
jgi:hypothetical protein